MRQLGLFLVPAFLMAFPTQGVGQWHLQPGERVRVLTVSGSSQVGVVSRTSSDSLMLISGTGTEWLRQGDVTYLERSVRRHRKFARNLAVTVGSVAGVSGMIAAIGWKECKSNQLFGCMMAPESRMDAFLFGGVVGGVLSVPVGVLVGLALQYDEWAPVNGAAQSGSSMSIRPLLDRGLGASVSFTF